MTRAASRAAILIIPLLLLLLLPTACQTTDATPPSASARLPTRAPTRTPTPTPIPTPVPVAAASYYAEGLAHQREGEAEAALRSLTWAIQLDPDFAPFYVARGGVYLSRGSLPAALTDAEAAFALDATDATAHALRGEVLRRLGRPRRALEALDRAVALDPSLASETFRSRWLAAQATRDDARLPPLSREYATLHPKDPLRFYYRGWGLTALGLHRITIDMLVRGIRTTPDPPALLWFTLGHAYAADTAWEKALTSFEAARMLVQAGDTSLSLHSDQPIIELFDALGRAYLGAGRCADAQAMLEYVLAIGGSPSVYEPLLEEARTCYTVTPTPTATPYLTVTPG